MHLEATHTCFDDALEFIESLVKEKRSVSKLADYRLAHGILLNSKGELYSHAWVESKAHCYHSGLLSGEKVMAVIDRVEYYEGMRVQERTLYTIRQAYRENYRTGYFGPWKERYMRLCRNPRPIS